jgi:proteasome accessory factor C
VREKVVAALGEDPARGGLQFAPAGGDDPEIAAVISRAIASRRLLSFDYYKANEDEFTTRTVEPYALINSRDAWYLTCFDPAKEAVRHFRLDRFKSATVAEQSFTPRADVDPMADIEGWPRTGEVPDARRARVWISPERARWEREERPVLAELPDGAVIVERGFASLRFLVRDVLKEAGDAVVLEPSDARAAVHAAAETIASRLGALAR